MDGTTATNNGPRFHFDSGALCLDFANTIPDRPLCSSDDLPDFDHLVAWGIQSGSLDEDEGNRLSRAARRHPDVADRAMLDGIALREGVYRIFSAHAAGADPDKEDLELLNRSLGQAMGHLRVGGGVSGFDWRWSNRGQNLDRVVWPVARSAGDLLVSDDLQWVRECASQTCSWLFLDTSRTRRRKWCDMSSCGNREKARRHYLRTKGKSQ